MTIKIGSNIASIQAQRRLGEATASLGKIYERLSSGQRINTASDDAAGLAIADSLRVNSRVFAQGIRNLNDGISLTNIADSALSSLSGIVTRVRELSEQAANGTLGSSQRKSLDDEAQALSKEYTRIIQTTKFNGMSLFNGSNSDISLQAGFGNSAILSASLGGEIGTGTFASATSYAMESTSSIQVELADLNNDGIQDMISGGTGGATGIITVRLGVGDGTFSSATSYSMNGTNVNGMRLADLNNDGNIDVVTGGMGGGVGSIAVRLGTGNGTFQAMTSYSGDPTLTDDIEVADFNGDGLLDLATAGFNAGTSQITFHYGTGGGQFGAASTLSIAAGAPIYSMASGDLNNDGKSDLVIARAGGNGLAMLGLGNGNFGSLITTGTFSPSNHVTLGDVNGDGMLDLVTTSNPGQDFVNIQLGNGNGTFGTVTQLTGPSATNGSTAKLADINGDSFLDIINSGTASGAGVVFTFLGNGNGTFQSAVSYVAESASSAFVTAGDLDRDGVLDIVSAGTGGGGRTTVRLGNSVAGVSPLLPFSLRNIAGARQSMGMLDQTLDRITAQRGQIGATQSRIDVALNNLSSSKENFSAAESRIRDADIAAEAANLIRTQILQQAATSVLAQANTAPQLALTLLR